jgi:glyoxylate utilization-related uncharacterized protein
VPRHRQRNETADRILGHFVDPDEGVRSSKDVGIKWDIHPAGAKRAQWTADDQRTTLVFLVSGKFRIDLTEGSFTLEHEGGYLAWGPGIDHSWEARLPGAAGPHN